MVTDLSKSSTEVDMLETDKNRPKIITVTLRTHDGLETHRPYSIKPDQVVSCDIY